MDCTGHLMRWQRVRQSLDWGGLLQLPKNERVKPRWGLVSGGGLSQRADVDAHDLLLVASSKVRSRSGTRHPVREYR